MLIDNCTFFKSMINTTYNSKDCLSVARVKTFVRAVLDYCKENNIEVTRENIINLRNNSRDKLIAFWEDKFVRLNEDGEKTIFVETGNKEIREIAELPYPEPPVFSDEEWREGRIPCDIDFNPLITLYNRGCGAIILNLDLSKTNEQHKWIF